MRCDYLLSLLGAMEKQFQSTHLHEVWLCGHSSCDHLVVVSIHTPTWGVTFIFFLFLSFHVVSIHTPTWGVTGHNIQLNNIGWVSIHTPTWGVTLSLIQLMIFFLFQSTHLHEVWRFKRLRFYLEQSFNPHTYMRCDLQFLSPTTREAKVSIHTPTWGVTMATHGCWEYDKCFNPHTYMRCDQVNG